MSYPEPLLPAVVDLRGMSWMPYYGDHLARSELNAHVSDAGYRAAHNLWWAAWNSVPAASLPDDDISLTRLADLGRDLQAFLAIKREALHGFVRCADGRLYHPFLADIALAAWGRRQHDRERKRLWRERQERGQGGDRTGTSASRDGGKDRRGQKEESIQEVGLDSVLSVEGRERRAKVAYLPIATTKST